MEKENNKKSIVIEPRIFLIREKKVMLDRDLARLYSVDTRSLNQAVKRNLARFPEDFVFRLCDDEVESLVSQSVIPSRKSFGGSLPYVFTEHGIAMLSAVLRSERAVAMSVFIVRAFIKLREAIATNMGLAHKVAELEHAQEKQGEKIESINRAVIQLIGARSEPREQIGFKDKDSID